MESNCQKRLRKNRGTKLEKLSKNQRLRRLCPWDLGQKSPRKGNSWGSDRTQRREAGLACSLTPTQSQGPPSRTTLDFRPQPKLPPSPR